MGEEETYVVEELTPSEALYVFLQVLKFLEWDEQRLIQFETWITTISREKSFNATLLATWLAIPGFCDHFELELNSSMLTLTWQSVSEEEDMSEEEFDKLPKYQITFQYVFPRNEEHELEEHKGELVEPLCFLFLDGFDPNQIVEIERLTEREWVICTAPTEED